MPTSCLSTALVVVLNTTFTSACSEDKPAEPTNFKAIALVLKDDVYRLWIRPNSDDAARKKAEYVTCSWQYYVLPVRGCHWLSEPSGHFTIAIGPHGERSQFGAGFTYLLVSRLRRFFAWMVPAVTGFRPVHWLLKLSGSSVFTLGTSSGHALAPLAGRDLAGRGTHSARSASGTSRARTGPSRRTAGRRGAGWRKPHVLF